MGDEHDAQENLGYLEMDTQKLAKANTKVLCTKNIYHRSTVEGGCANILSALLTVVDYDTETIEGNEVLFLHQAARRIALLMSSVSYRCYQERNTTPARSNYYMFAVLDRAVTHIAKMLRNKPSISAAAESSISNIQLECVVLADKVLETGLTHMLNVISGAEEAEISLIYTNSEFHRKALAKADKPDTKRQRDKSEANDLHTPPPTRQKQERGGKKAGPICWNGKGPMPMPDFDSYPKGEKPICAGTAKNDSWGCRAKNNCDLDHTPHDKWSKPKATFLQKFVKATTNMFWNKDVVSDEWLGINVGNRIPTKDKASGDKG